MSATAVSICAVCNGMGAVRHADGSSGLCPMCVDGFVGAGAVEAPIVAANVRRTSDPKPSETGRETERSAHTSAAGHTTKPGSSPILSAEDASRTPLGVLRLLVALKRAVETITRDDGAALDEMIDENTELFAEAERVVDLADKAAKGPLR